jgi:hypothetical protein
MTFAIPLKILLLPDIRIVLNIGVLVPLRERIGERFQASVRRRRRALTAG